MSFTTKNLIGLKYHFENFYDISIKKYQSAGTLKSTEYDIFLSELESIDITILTYLNHSILSGENYIVNFSNIDIDKLENSYDGKITRENGKILNFLDEIRKETKDEITRKRKELLDHQKRNGIFLKDRLKEYKKLCEYTKVKKDIKNLTTTEYDVNHLLNEHKDISFASSYQLNILLAKLDHDYHSGIEIERQLNRIYQHLEGLVIEENVEIFNILKDKANFLTYKILKRREKALMNKGLGDSGFSKLKGVRTQLNKKKGQIKYFKSFVDEIDTIEEKEINDERVYHKYHRLSKNYRKDGRVELINNLIVKFSLEESRVENDFDRIAYDNMVVFLETQKFRAELSEYRTSLKNDKINLNDIKKLYTAIDISFKSLESKTSKRRGYRFITEFNYAIQDTLSKIEMILDNKKYQIDDTGVDVIRLVRSSFINSVKIFIKYYQWSFDKNNIHIYSPFESCRHRVSLTNKFYDNGVDEKKISLDLFIDSSYVLPINFSKNRNDFETLAKANENTLSNIHFRVSEFNLKDVEKRTDKAVKKSQLNSIQIIAVFAALITFITSSSASFATENLLDVRNISFILITLILGFGIFSLLLKIIVDAKMKYVFFMLFTFVILFLIMIHFHSQIFEKTGKIFDEKVKDSINIETPVVNNSE